jgi:outer membrane protein assembly factor BamB
MLLSVLSPVCQSTARAQFFVTSRFELSDAVTLDQADSASRTHLERVTAFLADEQWDEAIETLRQVMENQSSKVVEISPGRYINMRNYCQMRLAALPAPALELYRQRVDAQAQRQYDEALAARDPRGLAAVADQWFASSVADQALFALGELRLEQGNHPAARACWEKLIETPPARIDAATFDAARRAEGLPADEAARLDRWYRPAETGEATTYELYSRQPIPDDEVRSLVDFWNLRGLLPKRLAYPRTDLNLADVRARLVLASILERSSERAADELAAFNELHPNAEGKIAGRSGPYAELLQQLLDSSGDWSEQEPPAAWSTFAANPRRNQVAPGELELGELKWQVPLDRTQLADSRLSAGFASPRRVAESQEGLLSYHPVVSGDVVFVASLNRIMAFRLSTGKPAWGQDDGVIYRDEQEALVRPHARHSSLGAPRFTLTVHGSKLFARIGSPITSSAVDNPFSSGSAKLICLDIAAQGRLDWEIKISDISADDDKWAFEGAPVCDGQNVYVALRRSDIRPQAHVACFDMQTGRERWRQFVCSAETPSRGQMDEITHNLLTLERDTIYYNTNLGAVAALAADDGAIRWITLYPRASDGDLNKQAAHFYRDLTPCIYDRGRLFVAPSDTERVLALNAQTGELLWRTLPGQPQDVVHLLGICGNKLVASGDRLWWFHADSGKLLAIWPDGPSPKGFGRGVIVGNEVVWPTQEELIRFDESTRQRSGIVRLIDRNATGGNLVAAGGYLLVATADTLYAFRNYGADDAVEDRESKPNDE